MREAIKKNTGPICFAIMIIEIVGGIIDRSVSAFGVALLAGIMGLLYTTDNKS